MLGPRTSDRFRESLHALAQGLQISSSAARELHAMAGSHWAAEVSLSGKQPSTPEGLRSGSPCPTAAGSAASAAAAATEEQKFAKHCYILTEAPNSTPWAHYHELYSDEALLKEPTWAEAPPPDSTFDGDADLSSGMENLLHSLRFGKPFPLGVRCEHWVPIRRSFKCLLSHLHSRGFKGTKPTLEQFIQECAYHVKVEHNGARHPFELLVLSGGSGGKAAPQGFKAIFIRAKQSKASSGDLASTRTARSCHGTSGVHRHTKRSLGDCPACRTQLALVPSKHSN
jgi:hypothetical protein